VAGMLTSLKHLFIEKFIPVPFICQATVTIRECGGLNQHTPIVAVTANAMKGDIEKVSTNSFIESNEVLT
jgi:hypothetical protein